MVIFIIFSFSKLNYEMEITASKHLTKSFMNSQNGAPKYLNMILNNDINTKEFIEVCIVKVYWICFQRF